ncbi:MAG TPA: hypothetical protein PK024_04580 [Methanospirillum sp.]|uniref:hypothetical protein n=1 Tax=Methanospirillum sp. TaxID=45200 RepID=UPI002CBB278B|nr:hypothetical protein [Methanospirillum sp.]HOJ96100.1 hypothetical protein [Methanospirillum sp.]HPP76775.1 hypothetical protein [Methanospirillum sp.]
MEELYTAVITIIVTLIGVGITYFKTNEKATKYLTIAKEAMDVIVTARDCNKTDAELGKEVREFFDAIHKDSSLPELTYKQ